VVITIADDGPGIPPLVLDALGEPYITTRPARQSERGGDWSKEGKPHGMGLGFFIAKTLLERSGATVSMDNRPAPATGAVAEIVWPRSAFESRLESRPNGHNGGPPQEQARFGRDRTGQDAPS
jgi:two-component system sensor histidine kinase RegB